MHTQKSDRGRGKHVDDPRDAHKDAGIPRTAYKFLSQEPMNRVPLGEVAEEMVADDVTMEPVV